MADELTAILTAWREVEHAATAGPWHNSPDTGAGRVWVQIGPIRSAYSADTDLEPLFNYRNHREPATEDGRQQQFRQRAADAKFITEARTAMPLLVAAVEAVLKLADEANELEVSGVRLDWWTLSPAQIREAIRRALNGGNGNG